MSMRLALACAPLLLGMASAAAAQAYQCRIPQGPLSVAPIRPDGPVRQRPIMGYSLSLSWAPEYCRGKETRVADELECSGKHGRFGLILHGLWPEARDAAWPQWCPNPRRPAPELLRENLCRTPSAELLAHEWAKHGSCMVSTPKAYFTVSRILFDALHLPDLDLLSRREGLTAGRIRESFIAANPLYPPNSVAVELNERGWLAGLKLCLDTKFMPRPCPRWLAGAKDDANAKIWRGL